jgi:ABC-type amino acid transport substrate-binding protein
MKIVIGGQVEKKEIEALVKQYGGDTVEVTVKNDLEAAMALKSGQADYYLGACYTGGGGALAMAIALLGKPNCATVSMPGQPPTQEKVDHAVAQGAKAFGFTGDHKDKAVEFIMTALTK